MGSIISCCFALLDPLSTSSAGTRRPSTDGSPLGDEITDEDAIALVSKVLSLPRLGPHDNRGNGPPVWRVAPNIVAKVAPPSELFMMNLASSQTSIPIPRVLKYIEFKGYHFILMDYIDGDDLYALWPTLNFWSRIKVAWKLRGYVRQLRAVELPNTDVPGPFDASGVPLRCEGHHFTEGGVGPFKSYSEMVNWYNGRSRLTYLLWRYPSVTGDPSSIPLHTAPFDDSMPLVFTHGDISTLNVRIAKDGTVWLLDWERAGAYPLWFEYANMMAYGKKLSLGKDYDTLIWPRGWKWYIPLVTGEYEKQLNFVDGNFRGINHYAFEGFD